MPDDQKEMFKRAQRIVDVLSGDSREAALTLQDISVRIQQPAMDVLEALRLLEGMSLVTVGTDKRSVVVRLVAIPDEHVPVVGPDNRRRWIFVARPLFATETDGSRLN